MPEDSTWDTASVEPPTEPAAIIAPEPVVPDTPADPPAEPVTLEKPDTPPLEVEPVPARESESQETVVPDPPKEEVKDEHEEGDTPEIQALPTPAAKRWARRQHQDAAPVRTFLDFDKPIKEFGDDLYKRSPSRYIEHAGDVVTQDKDFASKVLFGVSFEEAKTRLQTNVPTTTTPNPIAPVTDVALPTKAELEDMTFDEATARYQQALASQEQKAAQEKAQLESRLEARMTELQKQFDAVNGESKTERERVQQVEITDNQNKLLNNVMSVVDEVIRNSGLEVLPTDPPRIANLKNAAAKILKQESTPAFDAVPDNVSVVQYCVEAINRREFQNAFREEDNLKVRARAAAESVKASPEVKEILSEIEAYAKQSTAKPRAANPVPPAPGSTLGVTIKPPTTWDEAVQPAA